MREDAQKGSEWEVRSRDLGLSEILRFLRAASLKHIKNQPPEFTFRDGNECSFTTVEDEGNGE